MPPVESKRIIDTENALQMPLVSRSRLSEEFVELSDRDIRLGTLALNGLAEAVCELSQSDRTQMHLLYNLESFIDAEDDGLSTSQLREQQQDVFHDIYNFIATPMLDERGKPIRSGYIQLPTGAGKTAIFSTLVDVLNKPLPASEERLKTLVLVPKLDLISQTIGRDGQRGFAQFGQNTSVSEYSHLQKDLSGEAVVMTYQSLNIAVKNGIVGKDTFDFVICDEAHRALGPQTQESLKMISEDKLLIGLTATPDFSERKAFEVFPQKIHSLELREAVELGLLSPTQCYAIASDIEIETIKPGVDFTDEELASLIENRWRNLKAVEFAKSFIESGKQGIISCVPGENLKHAYEVAEALRGEFITDAQTGELRRIRAVAVAGTTLNRQDIYDAYEQGNIDVLTFVDVLTEGWDSTAAKFLINLRPTTSPVNAVQRLGRILRKADEGQVATVIEFVDKTDKPLFTFFHAFGEKMIDQGKVVVRKTKSGVENGGGGQTEGREVGAIDFPEEILKLIASIDHIELAKLIVDAKEKMNLVSPPDNYTSVTSLSRSLHLSPTTLYKLIEKYEIETEMHLYGGRPSKGLSSESLKSFLEVPELQVTKAPEGYFSLEKFAKELGVVPITLKRAIEKYEIETNVHRYGGSVAIGLAPTAQMILRTLPEFQIQKAPEGVISIRRFALLHGIKLQKVVKILVQEELPYYTYKFGARTAPGIDSETQAIVAAKLTEIKAASTPPEGFMSLHAFAQSMSMGDRTIKELIEKHGIGTARHSYSNKPGVSIGSEAQEQLRSIIEGPEKQSLL